jgi:hypothetical protein
MTIIASTATWIILGELSKVRYITYTYTVGVSAPGNMAYYLLLPSIVDVNGNVTPIMGDFAVVTGDGMFELTDTQFGKAVNLSGQGHIVADGGMKRALDGDFPPLNWSRHPNGDMDFDSWTGFDSNPEDDDLGSVWVFVHADWSGQPLSVSLTLSIGDMHHEALLETTQEGWQEVNVRAVTKTP